VSTITVAPTSGITAPQQLQLLQVSLALSAGADATALAAAAARVDTILETPAAFFVRHERAWFLEGPSSADASLVLTPALVAALDEVHDHSVNLVPQSAFTNDGVWTLLPCSLRPAPPTVLAIKGDWRTSTDPLLLFASTIAMGLRASALAERARLRLTTHRLAHLLSRIHGRDAVCKAIVSHAARAASAGIAAVALPDGSDRRLSIVATHGYPLALVEHLRIEPGSGIFGSVFQSGRSVHVKDLHTLPQIQRPRPRYRSSSFVAVPFRTAKEVLGVIAVTDRTSGGPFTRRDVAALRALAAPAALALGRERAQTQAEAFELAAAVDPLSGAFNRRHFYVRLEEELQRARRHQIHVALLMIDIDDFKVVNDSFGHLAGDTVIRDVAEILRRSVRVFDICARLGGEEFAIIMPGSAEANSTRIAERIRERIAAYQSVDPTLAEVRITVSIGLAVSSGAMAGRDLVARADQALYAAKHAGKNRVHAEVDGGLPP